MVVGRATSPFTVGSVKLSHITIHERRESQKTPSIRQIITLFHKCKLCSFCGSRHSCDEGENFTANPLKTSTYLLFGQISVPPQIWFSQKLTCGAAQTNRSIF